MPDLPPEFLSGDRESPVVLRCAASTDAEQLLHLEQSIVTEDRFLVSEIDEFDKTVESIERDINENGQFQLHVAEQSGQIIGFISFKTGARRRLRHQGSLVLCVSKQHRGRGIGSGLLCRLIQWVRQDAVVEKLGLSVRCDNQRAIEFYERHGFSVEGRLIKDLRLSAGVYVDSLLMCRFVNS